MLWILPSATIAVASQARLWLRHDQATMTRPIVDRYGAHSCSDSARNTGTAVWYAVANSENPTAGTNSHSDAARQAVLYGWSTRTSR